MQTRVRTAHARPTWRKRARRHRCVCLIKGRLSTVERTHWHQSHPVTKADSLGREDGRTGALSLLGSISGAFPAKAQYSHLQSSQNEPDVDNSLASLAKVHSPPAVVNVGLLDRMVGSAGTSTSQPCVSAICSVERLGVDDDATFHRDSYGLFG